MKYTTDYLKQEVMNRKTKDSVFTALFREPRYLLELYRSLHPEDTQTTEADLKTVTLEKILTDKEYNDLGFCCGDRLMILVEAQSTWTVNMAVRSGIYLFQSYLEYLYDTEQNVYAGKKVKLPKPELYVLYTGKRRERPEYLSLAEEFFGGDGSFLELRVKVLYAGSRDGDILNQYCQFAKIFDENRKEYGRTREAILRTIQNCREQGILEEFLTRRKKEVVACMLAMFNQDVILDMYGRSKIAEGRRKGEKIGEKRGEVRGKKRGIKRGEIRGQVKVYRELGLSMKEIAERMNMSVKKLEKICAE